MFRSKVEPLRFTVFSCVQIHYWERDRQNQSEKVKTSFTPDTHVRLTNLTSYTPYLVTLTAFNMAGDGPPSNPHGARTLQSGMEHSVGLALFFYFLFSSYLVCLSPHVLQLPASQATCPFQRWQEEVSMCPGEHHWLQMDSWRVTGWSTVPPRLYKVHTHTHMIYTNITCWGEYVFQMFCVFVGAGVSKVVTVDVRGSWQRWLKVRDLIKGATYTFSVQALTVSHGPFIKANLTSQPVRGRHVQNTAYTGLYIVFLV